MRTTLNTAKVIKAALRCVDRKGWAFQYARADARYCVINQVAFRNLEKVVAEYLAALKKRRKR